MNCFCSTKYQTFTLVKSPNLLYGPFLKITQISTVGLNKKINRWQVWVEKICSLSLPLCSRNQTRVTIPFYRSKDSLGFTIYLWRVYIYCHGNCGTWFNGRKTSEVSDKLPINCLVEKKCHLIYWLNTLLNTNWILYQTRLYFQVFHGLSYLAQSKAFRNITHQSTCNKYIFVRLHTDVKLNFCALEKKNIL